MPTLQLTTKYRLTSGFNSWELQERTKRKHRMTDEVVETWKVIKWYRSTEVALNESFELCLRTSSAEDIREAVLEAKNLLASAKQLLNGELNPKLQIENARLQSGADTTVKLKAEVLP